MNDKTMNFIEQAFAEALPDPTITPANLTILGGEFKSDQLVTFLEVWRDIPVGCFSWAMIEEVSRFYVRQVAVPAEALPDDPYMLERMRIFGPAADLDLRRDGDTFYWRFLGNTGISWPKTTFITDENNYWLASEAPTPFCERDLYYYQWRRTPDEQRVAQNWVPEGIDGARFNYLHQKHYLDNGRIAFVRYMDFKEQPHG